MRPTASNLKKIPIPDKGKTQHTLGSCFYLRVYASGRKAFYASYRRNGKFDFVKLGDFDGTKESIQHAQHALAKLQSNVSDNKMVPKTRRRNIDREHTFRAMWNRYIEDVQSEVSMRTLNEKKQCIERDVMPHWKDMHVADLTEARVIELYNWLAEQPALRPKYEGQKRPTEAIALTFRHLRHFFSWAYHRRFIDKHPAERIKLKKYKPRDDRMLKTWELKNIWFASEMLGYPHGVFMQICMMTGLRRSIVAGSRFSDFEISTGGTKYWLIQPQTMGNKARQAFKMKVTPLLQRYLDKIPKNGSDYLFPAKGNPDNPMSGFSYAKDKVNETLIEYNERMEKRGFETKHLVNDWRFHDFRCSMETTLADMEHDFNAIKVAMGQTPPSKQGVNRSYNLSSYRNKANRALEAWQMWLHDNVIHPDTESAKILEQLSEGEYRRPSKDTVIHFQR